MNRIALHARYLSARYDIGTANVFETVDSIARHLATHGDTRAECFLADLTVQAVESGSHSEACAARFSFLQYILSQLNDGATLQGGGS